MRTITTAVTTTTAAPPTTTTAAATTTATAATTTTTPAATTTPSTTTTTVQTLPPDLTIVGVANIQGLIQITYKNQGGGDSGPMTISWYYGNSPGGGNRGSRQVGPLGAGQTAIYGGNKQVQSEWINCEVDTLHASIAQNQGAPVPESNTANNAFSVVIPGNPSCS